jgi:hypothetical protein
MRVCAPYEQGTFWLDGTPGYNTALRVEGSKTGEITGAYIECFVILMQHNSRISDFKITNSWKIFDG